MSLTAERVTYLQGSLIVIGEVKNSDSVFRITVDSEYIQNVNGEYRMMYGCKLSIYKFNTTFKAMKMGIENYNQHF